MRREAKNPNAIAIKARIYKDISHGRRLIGANYIINFHGDDNTGLKFQCWRIMNPVTNPTSRRANPDERKLLVEFLQNNN